MLLEGHYVVAKVESGGIVRLFGFQKGGPAKNFIRESVLREISISGGGTATETFAMIIVNP